MSTARGVEEASGFETVRVAIDRDAGGDQRRRHLGERAVSGDSGAGTSYRGETYLEQTRLMRYKFEARRFLAEEIWPDQRRWAWDQAMIEERCVAPGSEREVIGSAQQHTPFGFAHLPAKEGEEKQFFSGVDRVTGQPGLQ